jgi:hypothetical protein
MERLIDELNKRILELIDNSDNDNIFIKVFNDGEIEGLRLAIKLIENKNQKVL